ncbi:hypothetical protein NPIL_656971 [Nephila pilipes]|uniref:Uncharacterized protein n=1 Tax=Nephila pilipes TaxID=299642 RepID=A0A8X6J138_NEPPI|nr:hypothetical protein NPIL_656971 [Nephila pilipes]
MDTNKITLTFPAHLWDNVNNKNLYFFAHTRRSILSLLKILEVDSSIKDSRRIHNLIVLFTLVVKCKDDRRRKWDLKHIFGSPKLQVTDWEHENLVVFKRWGHFV